MSDGAGGSNVNEVGTIVESCKAQVDCQSKTAVHPRGRDGTITFKSNKRTHFARAALPAFAALFVPAWLPALISYPEKLCTI